MYRIAICDDEAEARSYCVHGEKTGFRHLGSSFISGLSADLRHGSPVYLSVFPIFIAAA